MGVMLAVSSCLPISVLVFRGNARIVIGRVYRMVAISKTGDLQEQGVTSTLLW